MLQVEMNTISSSFASLSGKVSGLHDYLVQRYSTLLPESYGSLNLPSNKASSFASTGLAAAFQSYGKSSAAILMVVQEGEANR